VVLIGQKCFVADKISSGIMKLDSARKNEAMEWNGNVHDIDSVLAYLTSLKEEITADKFEERLDGIIAFYGNSYLGDEFIERARGLNENWHNKQKTLVIQSKLEKLLESNSFDEADSLFQEHTNHVEKSWYNKQKTLAVRGELEKLLESNSFDEADSLFQKHTDHVEKSWYENIRSHYYKQKFNLEASSINAELTNLLNQFCQLQERGIERSLWNQDYSQREYDEELIALVSKRTSEIREDLGLLAENWNLLIKEHKNKLTSSRKCITELKNILECETKKEEDSLDALNASWETVLSLQNITKVTKPILTENARKLILNWSQPYGPSTYKGKAMTSAREAEVAAFILYRNLYGKAEDISILQITSPEDDRWKYADIATNGQWIDIKNAITSFSSPNSYSEHCVPQFKLDRNKRAVSISAFLSQYNDDSTQPITWLGETTMDEIEKLQNEFDSQYLKVTFSAHLNKSFLPAWLFDYPSVCYADREAALARIRSPEFIFPRQECDIGIGVLANRVISSKTEGTLCLEAMELERRIKKCGLNRAVLFLHVLDRFCQTSLDDKTFKETGLDIILFSRFNRNQVAPLGVYDPLETIWNLWNVLVAISEKCLKETRRFTMFRLRGANILQGRTNDGRWLTVFAYCGGWLRLENGTSVRCGQNPIYLGQDYPCQSCGHLICHRCGFCSTQCSDCKMRQDHWSSKIED